MTRSIWFDAIEFARDNVGGERAWVVLNSKANRVNKRTIG
jgi:hypothetical protein